MRFKTKYLVCFLLITILVLSGYESMVTEASNIKQDSQLQQSTIDGLTADEWSEKGIEFSKNNDSDNAIIAYNKAISLNTNKDFFYFLRGREYIIKGFFDIALDDFNKAISLNPQHAAAYLFRGTIYQEKKNYDTAINDYKNAIANSYEQNKINSYAKTMLASAYHSNSLEYWGKNNDKALIEVNNAIALGIEVGDSKIYRFYQTKARICDESNLKNEAVDAYRKYLQNAPAGDEDIDYTKKRLVALGH